MLEGPEESQKKTKRGTKQAHPVDHAEKLVLSQRLLKKVEAIYDELVKL